MSSTTNVKGFVLEINNFEESDEIVTLFSNLGFLPILARGTRKVNSKNKVALQFGNLVECEVFLARYTDKMSKLKKATIINQLDFQNELVRDFYIELFAIIKKTKISNYFLHLEDLDSQIKEYGLDIVRIWHFAKMLYFIGYDQRCNGCAKCDTKKNIASFNLFEGGLLCIHHLGHNKIYSESAVREFIFMNKLDLEEYVKVFSKSNSALSLAYYRNFYSTI